MESRSHTLTHLEPLNEKSVGFKELNNLLDELIIHISAFGIFGGIQATISYMIQLEFLKKRSQDLNTLALFSYIITSLSFVKATLSNHIEQYEANEQIMRFSSDKILKLLRILTEYPKKSKEELCAIIFTKRRFTAKIIYHILDSWRRSDPDYAYIKPDYIVGYNNNPYNATRENLFVTKKNKEVINSFRNKEINVLVSSSVLEEGVDMQKCTLVVKFDLPEDYRGYIQSKGRARHKDSFYIMLVEKSEYNKFFQRYKLYQAVEIELNKVCIMIFDIIELKFLHL